MTACSITAYSVLLKLLYLTHVAPAIADYYQPAHCANRYYAYQQQAP